MNITRSDLEQYGKAFDTTNGLAAIVRRLIQEVEVLKSMLESRNVWDKEQYKRLLKQRMIDDHSSLVVPGSTIPRTPTSWTNARS
jgi:hypothetical protein